MPYFERLPYIEMISKAAGIVAQPVSAPSVPLMERAAAILQEESRGLPASGGPVASPAANIALPANGWTAALPQTPPPLPAGSSLGTLMAPTVKSGDKSVLTVSILNDSDESVPFSMTATDLVSQSGSTIPRASVLFIPASASVAPRSNVDVQVEIQVPPGSAGDYVGVLACSGASPGILLLTAT